MIDIIFLTLAFFALAGGYGMVTCKQPIHSALSLIVSILALAGLFALLSASFLFMVQIIVYAGAIITLLLFIIMFLNIKEENLPKEDDKTKLLIIGSIVLIPFNILIIKAFSTLPSKSLGIKEDGFGSIKDFGEVLFNNWLIPFELISILLLSALVGAVVYARKDKYNG
ncbi:MAG TPA: NADH-quinone oxidoreductase subunit J [Sulfurospirillum sp. UBA11407]|jgi:NADH-quinone oxidoreductase subunit J|nr:MAG TPA: NADH-quinone oxidoreductase subunit J [Sulfurospirillum sp. UBA11407]DAB33379.1 MAG TPA: NADH-quinone oxidoreductase subunit J [Sulfurospirillum sp. UBA12182]